MAELKDVAFLRQLAERLLDGPDRIGVPIAMAERRMLKTIRML